ncbi:hypothetical protein P7D22_21095 [Lichenihabitans sp. Uapishka_5]|uniref:helix-turn-helix domain-containing protein n=1 Tax=Lichenihabitans sp. Uapishka_5 TaxID=3037302 RepID=UPI0029E8208A|nr:hypothetical protein [Lichenihabitans sp. Uapishka_5]MDX7953665.1 hypothetical protein [Lichenihabitans sp. Uapishka_5]
MALVYIVANAPWGPVRLKTAGSMAELLKHATMAPAYVEDVGDRDPAAVVEAAWSLLPQADASGWIAERLDKASGIVAQAVSCVPARAAAYEHVIASPEPSVSHGGPVPAAKVRRRLGVEVDAKAIRAGLGMSQPEFAKAFGIPLATLRDWEQERSIPDEVGRSLLLVIEHNPGVVKEALAG